MNSNIVVVGDKLTFSGKTYKCAIGKNGFSADKKEGDGRTPLGIFPLRECWYRADKMTKPQTNLPIKIIHENDGWCDDAASHDYNRHVLLLPPLPLGEGRGEGKYKYASLELIDFARALRKESTSPEMKLWSVLRNRQMNGQKFRRQHPIEHYIADFYCEEMKLIIELDGESHFTSEGKNSDAVRSKYLQEKGYQIIRFSNAEIRENFEAVIQSIYAFTNSNALTPALSQREREKKAIISHGERGQVPRHEKLWRDDNVYDIVIPIGYNDSPIIAGKGSAIFIHIARESYKPTEGCVALKLVDLLEILPFLYNKTVIEIKKM
jgi:L,D-peptidoglycan transpeptidase YkuD (ErfK/YbiS/YcfS/YnhG family)